jgi:hypothetical protein
VTAAATIPDWRFPLAISALAELVRDFYALIFCISASETSKLA